MSEYKTTKIDIFLSEVPTCEWLYNNNYTQDLHIDFIENKEEKKHNINSHANWFNKKIKVNHEPESIDVINKWKLCMVDYGMNIGTEINGVRPSLVFKSSNAKYGEDLIVIPITSYEDGLHESKSIDQFDIEIIPNTENNLSHKSLLKLRQIRCISKKRVKSKKWSTKLNIFWEILDIQMRESIQTTVRMMLWI